MLAVGLAVLGLGLSACPNHDAGCTKPNCEVLQTCAVGLYYSGYCAGLPLGGETPLSIDDRTLQGCVDVCIAGQDGPLLQCVADKFPDKTCLAIVLDGGDRLASISATCVGSPSDAGSCSPNCVDCWSHCYKLNVTCATACSDAGTLGACISCTADCAVKLVQCTDACPST